MVKYLVTGAAGFIGYHVVKKLATEGFEVIGFDNLNDYYDQDLKLSRLKDSGVNTNNINYGQQVQSECLPTYHFIKMNLEDKDSLDTLFNEEKFSHIIHLAAQAGVRYSLINPQAYLNSNIQGFFNIIEASRQHNIQHFVYASSSSVYGMNSKQPFSESDNVDHPISLYAATKKSNELVAHTYSHLYGLPTTGLRFFTVYGPWGRPDMALFIFTKAILAGDSIEVFNFGNMLRDFTYIDDVVDCLVNIVNEPDKRNPDLIRKNADQSSLTVPYRIYNIGSSNPIKLIDFISTIENAIGKKIEKKYLPIQKGDVLSTYADVSSIENKFDYKPQFSYVDGINKFVKWYKDFYHVK
jgi:UDP-glucuronate 4-epimerase